MRFCPPDVERVCWRHVEALSRLVIGFSVSGWLILRNKYIEMHGQQNIKKKSHRRHGSLSVVIVLCCQVEVSSTS